MVRGQAHEVIRRLYTLGGLLFLIFYLSGKVRSKGGRGGLSSSASLSGSGHRRATDLTLGSDSDREDLDRDRRSLVGKGEMNNDLRDNDVHVNFLAFSDKEARGVGGGGGLRSVERFTGQRGAREQSPSSDNESADSSPQSIDMRRGKRTALAGKGLHSESNPFSDSEGDGPPASKRNRAGRGSGRGGAAGRFGSDSEGIAFQRGVKGNAVGGSKSRPAQKVRSRDSLGSMSELTESDDEGEPKGKSKTSVSAMPKAG